MIALPGWFDTGITASVTASGSGAVIMFGRVPDPPSDPSGQAGAFVTYGCGSAGATLAGYSEIDHDAHTITHFAQVTGTGLTEPVVVESNTEPGTFDGGPLGWQYPMGGMSGAHEFSATSGPYRLGARYIWPDGMFPEYANYARMEYGWFSDESTIDSWTYGSAGASVPQYPPGATPVYVGRHIPRGTASVGLYSFGFEGLMVTASAMTFNEEEIYVGDIDTHYSCERAPQQWLGTGNSLSGYGTQSDCNPDFSSGMQFTEPAGWKLNYDLTTTKQGSGNLPAKLDDNNLSHTQDLISPVSETFEEDAWIHQVEEGLILIHLHEDYLTESELLDLDFMVPQYPSLPKSGDLMDAGEDRAYYPVTITIPSSVPILPGIEPFVSSDTSRLTVSGTTVTVTGEGATLSKNFAEKWRAAVGLGPNGKDNPLFAFDGGERTKHTITEDVWSWGSHAYLELVIDWDPSPNLPEGELILTVDGVHLEISDTYVTGSTRKEDFEATTTEFSKVYAIAPLVPGSNTIRIDLLVPIGGPSERPFYYGRVDKITFDGFVTGTYTFTSINLVATRALLKLDWGPAIARQLSKPEWEPFIEWSALVIDIDGCPVLGNLPDKFRKGDEVGDHGGGLRFVKPLTGVSTGTPLDESMTLQEFIGRLDAIEGINAEYSQSAHDAAFKDDWGFELSQARAQWIRPIVPYVEIEAGTPFLPPCSAVVGSVWTVGGPIETKIYANWPFWGSLETLVFTSTGQRAESVEVEAVRTSDNVVVATATTDEFGVASLSPIYANGEVNYEVRLAAP